MGFYDDMQALASGLLADFKQGSITYVARTPGNGPTYNPGAPGETPTVLPGAVASGASKRFIDAGLAVAGDLVVVSSIVAGLTPKMGDQLTINGVRWNIVGIDIVPPSGTPVVWNFIVRK